MICCDKDTACGQGLGCREQDRTGWGGGGVRDMGVEWERWGWSGRGGRWGVVGDRC